MNIWDSILASSPLGSAKIQSGESMAEKKKKKLDAKSVARLCEKVFAMPVQKITAPGGKSRESLRVHFAVKTIVATQRSRPGRMRMEVEVLKRLTQQGAPVPAYLGGSPDMFFQEDVGSRRLSGELANSNEAGRLDVAARATESLLMIREAGKKAKLAEVVPELGATSGWIAGFAGTAAQVSEKFDFPPPELDIQGLVDRLLLPADTFIKWDARPGNASIGPKGQVYWFDWEHCGKRQGMEDFAWLAGDEFWPVGAADMLTILQDQLPKEQAGDDIDYLGHYITFHIVQRLKLILNRHKKAGWVNPETAMKYDKIGVDPALGVRLCENGAIWADRAALTRPMMAWFKNCNAALNMRAAEEKSA